MTKEYVDMKRKIIFFDIDGTILSNRTFSISDSTRAAILKAQENGHLVFINTGRAMAEIGNEITDIGFDGYICGCGTYIIYEDKELFHKTISPKLISRLIEDMRRYRVEALLEGTGAIYYDRDDAIQNPILKEIKHYHMFSQKFNIGSWDDKTVSFDKFCIWASSDELFYQFQEIYKNNFDFIHRRDKFYEVVPKGYSKATGIEYILGHLNIAREDTYALGDSSNDLSMLLYVKHSIAMGNSIQDIINMASYVTKDVDEEGVACALKHYNII
jgi:Cof subfamily protein (haloacid dehalogenase superfamily)